MKIPIWLKNHVIFKASAATYGYETISSMHSHLESIEGDIVKLSAERETLMMRIEIAYIEKNEAIEFLQELNK